MRDIRKVAIGVDYKNNAMHYVVGQKILKESHEIHLIQHDEVTDSINIYIINNNQEVFLWKSFNCHMPRTIEYNIDF